MVILRKKQKKDWRHGTEQGAVREEEGSVGRSGRFYPEGVGTADGLLRAGTGEHGVRHGSVPGAVFSAAGGGNQQKLRFETKKVAVRENALRFEQQLLLFGKIRSCGWSKHSCCLNKKCRYSQELVAVRANKLLFETKQVA